MFLKKLESVGFKSFAERIQVAFVPGVTAVVGPNGSGKSNITDAIRWVLGEQSAKSLRGSKMEDIIFQGSDSRKKLNVAEVTLLLDNTENHLPIDYDEVSVTRRVYRSGESEFYINKQVCRLKDIVDLFMDSGLGREAFSIISQGKVEEILSSKAVERRAIFEEAAGVLKYKQRKKKAEFKLAETKGNLNRVEDIMHEINQQIEPLEEQAMKAEKYLAHKADLKEKEVSLLVTMIDEVHGKYEALKHEIEQEKMAEIAMQTNIQQKQAELESARRDMQHQDEQIEQVQAQLVETIQALEQFSGKKQVLKERIKHFSENKEKLDRQKNEISHHMEQTSAQLEDDEKKLHTLKNARKDTAAKIKRLEETMVLKEEKLAEQIEDLKSQYIEYLNEQAAKHNEQQTIKQQEEQISRKQDRQTGKFQDLLNQRESLDDQYTLAKEELNNSEQFYKNAEQQMEQLKAEVSKEQQQFRDGQTKLYQGYRYIENLKSKKEMLEEMKEDFQGFFHGVKAVLQAKQQEKLYNIHGAVIELLDVEKQFITAIDTVLGGSSQHIVVENDRSARDAIAWLKKTNNGRATFLPLASIQERFIPAALQQRVEAHDGYVGIAANLVRTEAAYQKAINHLMGHVIIAKTLKDANEIAQLTERRFRVVTLEGDVVNPGGSMSGGAQKRKANSLFTREKDLQEISASLVAYEEKAAQLEASLQKKKQKIAMKEKELETLETSIYKSYQHYQEARTREKELASQLDYMANSLAIFDQEEQQYIEDSSELQARKKRLSADLKQLNKKISDVQAQMEELTAKQKEVQENQEKQQSMYYEMKITLAEQDERIKNQQERCKQLQGELASLREQHRKTANELDELMALKKADDHAEEVSASIQQKQAEKEELTKNIQELRRKRSDQGKWIADQDRELKEENKVHSAKVKEVQQKEVNANRMDVELENHLSQLATDYAMTYEKAKQTYEKVADMTEAKMIVQQTKKALEALGTVNLGAIDEFKRISERKEFLSAQQDDLVQASATLREVIAEMDAEMEALFGETFDSIKEAFSEVFKELFAGGHAELKLTDEKNLLETGVDIIAQPPGKKLQHLSLLSGGERALTAIALLFAILRVRPVPFCVLDEVEAALDEANVVRFAKYIKKYSDNTQFIVITHRKGTMEEANVLYGVTMQESGVSRLVSVRLEETKALLAT